MTIDPKVEDLLRRLAPQVLGTLVRRHGRFDLCEDAVQEALVTAATRWHRLGVPERPHGWLLTVASRRLTDELRRDGSRRQREHVAAQVPTPGEVSPSDDTLLLLLLCCHPALTPASQVALTLRAVGGLTTAEIARAFLVPEATMAQRISRAKQTLRSVDATFELPGGDDDPARIAVVCHVLYLIFSEGYTASTGPELQRAELATEAIRLARQLHERLPDHDEVAGLLALMVLSHARAAVRVDETGSLVPLPDQDRSRWDRALIAEGIALLEFVLPRGTAGPYQLQAAIAAVHAEAPDSESTDWPQILGLYDLLQRIEPNPMVSLNRIVALAEVVGPQAALGAAEALGADGRIADHHRLAAVRGHLYEKLGDRAEARAQYRLAARGATSLAERRHLERRAAQLVVP